MDDKESLMFGANGIYLAVAVALITIGTLVQRMNVKIGLIITEYILVLLPPLFFLKYTGKDYRKFLKLNRLRIKHGLFVVIITILNYPVALFFNLLVMTILSAFGELKLTSIPTAINLSEYVQLFLIMAFSAGICEEIFFRGFLLTVYEEKFGYKAIFITSIMFAIIHFNIQNFLGPLVLGVLFAYLVRITGSIYAGIIGHITNNGIAVTLGYLMNIVNQRIREYTYASESIGEKAISTIQLSAATIGLGFIALLCGGFAYLLIRQVKREISEDSDNLQLVEELDNDEIYYEVIEEENVETISFLPYIPVAIVFVIFCILTYFQL